MTSFRPRFRRRHPSASPRPRRSRRPLSALGAGALGGLGLVPFALVPVGLAGLVLSMVLWRKAPTVKGAFGIGWLVGVGYFAVTLHWIVEPFLVDIARHAWMAPFALVFTAGGFALFWGGAFAAARWLAPSDAPHWRAGAALVLCWTAAEMLRSKILTGFPWALVGYTWTEDPAIQLVALVGP